MKNINENLFDQLVENEMGKVLGGGSSATSTTTAPPPPPHGGLIKTLEDSWGVK
jgi:hypothetical protein